MIQSPKFQRYHRAVMLLIDESKSKGGVGVGLIDDRLAELVGGLPLWDDPSARFQIIPYLQQEGYSILNFNNDSSCPMAVHWDYAPSVAERQWHAASGWTWHSPIDLLG